MKLLKVIILTSLLTCLLVLYKHDLTDKSLEPETSDRRYLVTREEYESLCVKGNVTLGLAENFVGVSNTLRGWIDYLNITVAQDIDVQIQAAFTGDTSQVGGVVIQIVAPYIIFLIFGILTLIAWLTYSICCCKTCLCCKSSSKDESGCGIKFISCIVMLVGIIAAVGLCIIGFIYSTEYSPAFDDMECSLMRFYSELVYGQGGNQVPRWIGFSGIRNKVSQVSSALDQVAFASRSYSPDTSFASADSNFDNELSRVCNSYSSSRVRNPNTSPSTNGGETTVIPNYILVIAFNIYSLSSLSPRTAQHALQ